MTARPPSRYRIVERDRRLEVIDTWAEGSPTPRGPLDPSKPPRSILAVLPAPEQAGFDGRATLTTHRAYDLKGPRTVLLDPGSVAMLGRLKLAALSVAFFYVLIVAVTTPWLLMAPVFLFQPTIREPVRAWITKWLGRFEAPRDR